MTTIQRENIARLRQLGPMSARESLVAQILEDIVTIQEALIHRQQETKTDVLLALADIFKDLAEDS